MTMTQSESEAAHHRGQPKDKGKTGARILHEMLIGPHKVEYMFGYPGGAILPVFDELYKTPGQVHPQPPRAGVRPLRRRLRPRDRQARRVHRDSGPGATNTVTPLATAQMDSIPIVVFSGQVPTKVIGNDAFQEADVTGITAVHEVELPGEGHPRAAAGGQRGVHVATSGGRAGADRPAEGHLGRHAERGGRRHAREHIVTAASRRPRQPNHARQAEARPR
jgi:hypothetical protein